MRLYLKIATLILAVFCLYIPTSASSRRGEILHLDQMQGNMSHEIICGSGVAVDPNAFDHASGSRPVTAAAGDQNGSGSEAHGGGVNDHHSNHRNHNGSNRNCNDGEFVTLIFTILACLLLRQNI